MPAYRDGSRQDGLMHLVQLFLPLYDEKGSIFAEEHFATVRHYLTENLGGITTYSRAPRGGISWLP
jgi:hypothetical protein